MPCSALTHTHRQTYTKVNTEDTLSGFQEFFLQPIIKDRSNNTHWHTTPLCKLSRLHCDIDLLTRSKIFFLIRVISLVSKTEVGPNAPSIQSTFYGPYCNLQPDDTSVQSQNSTTQHPVMYEWALAAECWMWAWHAKKVANFVSAGAVETGWEVKKQDCNMIWKDLYNIYLDTVLLIPQMLFDHIYIE